MKRTACITLLVVELVLGHRCLASEMEWIKVSADSRGFVTQKGTPFIPWGVNYDHDRSGRLIEDYWDTEWEAVEEDFLEMKEIGANVARIHIQFGRFMNGPSEPNRAALAKLGQLLKLAEATGLYLDITGLGCYHKKDVPPWYDAMDEQGRWAAQVVFWEAVARVCADSPAVFCYDLMNEPVSPAGPTKTDWLGPALGDKHFVQYISLDLRGRDRVQLAKQWVDTLVAAIRRHDPRHMITVGLVDWSLERPGLKSGFVPSRVTTSLDFVSVHIYPESGKLDHALETLRGFQIGKPVVVEETFALKCSVEELAQFMDRAGDDAAGWMMFYWGQTPQELQESGSIREAILLKNLELFSSRANRTAGPR